MSPDTDQQRPNRRARLLSHAARKYSRQLRRVTNYLEARDRLATRASTVHARVTEPGVAESRRSR